MPMKQKIAEKRSLSVVKLGGAYDSAPIEMWITGDEVGIRMGLNTFIAALVAKTGNPALVFTQAKLQERLLAAADEVVAGMKAETTRVV